MWIQKQILPSLSCSQPKPSEGPQVQQAFSVNDPKGIGPSETNQPNVANEADMATQPVTAAQDLAPAPVQGAHAIPTLPDIPHVQLGTPVTFTVNPSPTPEPFIPTAKPTVPVVATRNVSATRSPKSGESKESRQIKRLSSSGEEPSHCTQSRSFRALEHLLFEGEDSGSL